MCVILQSEFGINGHKNVTDVHEDTGIRCRANRRRLMTQKKIDYSTHNALVWLIGGLRPSDREAVGPQSCKTASGCKTGQRPVGNISK